MKKLMSLGLVSASVLVLGTNLVQAAETTTLPVTSEGKVQLNDTWEEGGIINPPTTGPEIIDPEKPVLPAGDRDLALVYYPSFDFGVHDYDGSKAVTYKAASLKGTVTNPENPELPATNTELAQFVQVRNSSAIKNWKLMLKATDFQADDRGTPAKGDAILKGAQIRITKIQEYNNTTTGGKADAAKIPTGAAPYIPLSENAEVIGEYHNTGITGISRNSFVFGEVETDKEGRQVSSGIELYIPANLDITKDGKYTSTLTWSFANVD